jgi:sugar-specific transcriptional regulator TrmB
LSFEANTVETLTQLGLTILESRVYVTLCKFRILNTKELSKLTKTARPDTYRVLTKLQNKGLVEKIIEKPTRFRAVPFEKGVNFLLQRKNTEHIALSAKSQLLIETFKESALKVEPDKITIEPHFTIIPQREIVVKRIKDAIDRSEKTVDLYLTWKRLVNGLTGVFIENCEHAWKRGVNFRIIVESPEGAEAQKQALKFSKKSPFCSIRFLSGKSKTVTGIYDKKEVFIIVNPAEDLFDSPALWSNNQSLITAIQGYFDILWLISKEQPNQKSDVISKKMKKRNKTT